MDCNQNHPNCGDFNPFSFKPPSWLPNKNNNEPSFVIKPPVKRGRKKKENNPKNENKLVKIIRKGPQEMLASKPMRQYTIRRNINKENFSIDQNIFEQAGPSTSQNWERFQNSSSLKYPATKVRSTMNAHTVEMDTPVSNNNYNKYPISLDRKLKYIPHLRKIISPKVNADTDPICSPYRYIPEVDVFEEEYHETRKRRDSEVKSLIDECFDETSPADQYIQTNISNISNSALFYSDAYLEEDTTIENVIDINENITPIADGASDYEKHDNLGFSTYIEDMCQIKEKKHNPKINIISNILIKRRDSIKEEEDTNTKESDFNLYNYEMIKVETGNCKTEIKVEDTEDIDVKPENSIEFNTSTETHIPNGLKDTNDFVSLKTEISAKQPENNHDTKPESCKEFNIYTETHILNGFKDTVSLVSSKTEINAKHPEDDHDGKLVSCTTTESDILEGLDASVVFVNCKTESNAGKPDNSEEFNIYTAYDIANDLDVAVVFVSSKTEGTPEKIKEESNSPHGLEDVEQTNDEQPGNNTYLGYDITDDLDDAVAFVKSQTETNVKQLEDDTEELPEWNNEIIKQFYQNLTRDQKQMFEAVLNLNNFDSTESPDTTLRRRTPFDRKHTSESDIRPKASITLNIENSETKPRTGTHNDKIFTKIIDRLPEENNSVDDINDDTNNVEDMENKKDNSKMANNKKGFKTKKILDKNTQKSRKRKIKVKTYTKIKKVKEVSTQTEESAFKQDNPDTVVQNVRILRKQKVLCEIQNTERSFSENVDNKQERKPIRNNSNKLAEVKLCEDKDTVSTSRFTRKSLQENRISDAFPLQSKSGPVLRPRTRRINYRDSLLPSVQNKSAEPLKNIAISDATPEKSGPTPEKSGPILRRRSYIINYRDSLRKSCVKTPVEESKDKYKDNPKKARETTRRSLRVKNGAVTKVPDPRRTKSMGAPALKHH